MIKLGVNIDHIATLRQARKGLTPCPLKAALLCQKAGADSIVAHLREDRRHIQDRDLLNLKKGISVRLNLEMSLAKEIVIFALKLKPQQVTLVPEKREELTTEGGLDIIKNYSKIAAILNKFQARAIEVSVFINPDEKQIRQAKNCGVKIIEIHTGSFADSKNKFKKKSSLSKIINAVGFANSIGLQVNAGHGLDYNNVGSIAAIEGINELNIGYSIICRALFVGMEKAVLEMKELIK